MNLGTFCPLEKHQQILTPLLVVHTLQVAENKIVKLDLPAKRH
jgi:hypothetical protein